MPVLVPVLVLLVLVLVLVPLGAVGFDTSPIDTSFMSCIDAEKHTQVLDLKKSSGKAECRVETLWGGFR